MKRLALVLLAAYSGASLAAQVPARPNFVWLVSEDNSKHFLKLFDADGAPTPRIEALANRECVWDRDSESFASPIFV